MEAFSLHKHSNPENDVVSGAGPMSPYSSDEEDETYFDLQFAIPDEEEEVKRQENGDETEYVSSSEEETENEEEEAELKFSPTSNEGTDQNVSISPSNELSGVTLNDSEEENSKFPVSLLKSATKFRVLLLKLKKSKSDEANGGQEIVEETQKNLGKGSSKLFTVKLKVEEIKFPLVSLFTRDGSKNLDSNDRNLTKEVVQKYLKMVKPFYVRVSKRYVEKMKFSGQLSFSKGGAGVSSPPCERSSEVLEPAPALENVKVYQKPGNNNLQTGLKVVRKHLGKSRSGSALVAENPPGKVVSSRRDDSLLQVQDGIQGAILHCKRSFNASRDPI